MEYYKDRQKACCCQELRVWGGVIWKNFEIDSKSISKKHEGIFLAMEMFSILIKVGSYTNVCIFQNSWAVYLHGGFHRM